MLVQGYPRGSWICTDNGLATLSPHSQTKSYQTEPGEKAADSVWLPGPEVCRKLEGSWPDCTRQRQNITLFTKGDEIWRCQANVLQTSGPGNQREPAGSV